ncbi:PA-phosphatase [Aureimonas sp. Leaf454]|uniref:phosphatase PAP2 family protein n=1 Tax=Aureimonas sp. Leaf454 TaxID=1736381 RepID=UPI0006F4EBE8|nr:phosphatase PAP2 family protein [Aureimonas sp. Leaf454]KQT50727.1 PA-phosphatase [Aureimonas sp. Leaf454]
MKIPSPLNPSAHPLAGPTLVVLVIVCAAIWGFVALAGEVMEGETHQFDTWLLLSLRDAADPANPYGPGWLRELVRDFTALGGTGILTLLTIATALFLRLQGNKRSMWVVLAAVGGGFLMSSLLKHGFSRPRPELVPHGSIVYTASFPSGHAMLSSVTYLTLATIVARVQPRRAMKIYVFTVAILLTLAVGFSRVYLGVHWPTDVVAGWVAGSAWAIMWWALANWLELRGVVEPEQSEPTAAPAG